MAVGEHLRLLCQGTESADLLRRQGAACGDALLSPAITRQLISEYVARRREPVPERLGVLTNRERNDEIAARI